MASGLGGVRGPSDGLSHRRTLRGFSDFTRCYKPYGRLKGRHDPSTGADRSARRAGLLAQADASPLIRIARRRSDLTGYLL